MVLAPREQLEQIAADAGVVFLTHETAGVVGGREVGGGGRRVISTSLSSMRRTTRSPSPAPLLRRMVYCLESGGTKATSDVTRDFARSRSLPKSS